MTFKEQMQQWALEYSKEKRNYIFPETAICAACIRSSQAALTSDLVKGLVEALEEAGVDIMIHNSENYILIDTIRAALTNYKQEVKQ